MAKAAIYLMSSLALFGFAFFWFSARGYKAAAPDDAPPPVVGAATPTDAAAPEAAADSAEAVAADSSGAEEMDVPQEPADEAAKAEAEGEAAEDPRALANSELAAKWAEEALAGAPKDGEEDPLPDEAALQAELDRLAAAGFEVDGASPEFVGDFFTTAYCCEVYPHICGGNGVTASGTVPTPGLTCAADWSMLPSGTWLYIDGVGVRRVEDTGSAIKQYKLDIAIDTHQNALAWRGLGTHDVWVLSRPGLRSRR